jgi:hypothetical protein
MPSDFNGDFGPDFGPAGGGGGGGGGNFTPIVPPIIEVPAGSSGPPYPQPINTIADTNAIGNFIIGESQIGDIIPFYYWQTIISQYANSNTIDALIAYFQQWFDQTINYENLYDLIWNVTTAQGYGLDVWGRIVGVVRTLGVASQPFWGFQEQNPTTWTFNQGIFYTGTGSSPQFYLTDSSFRTLIFAKAMANISNGSAPSINAILRTMFPNRGNAWVSDNGNMSISYNFSFFLTGLELALVTSGVLPKSSGCTYTVNQGVTGGVTGVYFLQDDAQLSNLYDDSQFNQLYAG